MPNNTLKKGVPTYVLRSWKGEGLNGAVTRM